MEENITRWSFIWSTQHNFLCLPQSDIFRGTQPIQLCALGLICKKVIIPLLGLLQWEHCLSPAIRAVDYSEEGFFLSKMSHVYLDWVLSLCLQGRALQFPPVKVILLCLLPGAKGLWKHVVLLSWDVMIQPHCLLCLPLSSGCEAQIDLCLRIQLPHLPAVWSEGWGIQKGVSFISFCSYLHRSESVWLLQQQDKVYPYILLWKHNEGLLSPLGGRSLGNDSPERLRGDLSGEQPRW